MFLKLLSCHFLLDIFQAIYTTHLEWTGHAEPGLRLGAEPMVPSKGELHLGDSKMRCGSFRK